MKILLFLLLLYFILTKSLKKPLLIDILVPGLTGGYLNSETIPAYCFEDYGVYLFLSPVVVSIRVK